MKKATSRRLYRCNPLVRIFSVIMTSIIVFSPTGLLAGNLPTGGIFTAGSGSITSHEKTMNINQTSQKAVTNWNTFNIGVGNTVNVIQPNANAAMLARVIGDKSCSQIMGNLNANGIFYLVNPGGILFGKTAQVDVNKLIATTMNISNADFMNGIDNFSGDSLASVINKGNIKADTAILLANTVKNTGMIQANHSALIAAQNVKLSSAAGGKISIDFSDWHPEEGEETLAVNAGTMTADADAENSDVTVFAKGGIGDNSEGVITAKDVEISGSYVDLLNLGEVNVESLLIDPDGTLVILDDFSTSSDNDVSWSVAGDVVTAPSGAGNTYYISEGKINTSLSGVVDTLTIEYDNIVIGETGFSVDGIVLGSNTNAKNLILDAKTGDITFMGV